MFKRIVTLVLLIFIAYTPTVISQEKIGINDLNIYLDRYVGKTVELTGYLYVDEINDKIELWQTLPELMKNTRNNWDYHIELKKGSYLPSDIDDIQQALVVVTGKVEKTKYTYEFLGDNLEIALIEVDNFEIKKKSIFPPFNNGKDFGDMPQATCDSCKFAILFNGFRTNDFWNDIKQKYDYKKNKHKVCPNHIVVLNKGGTQDAAIIPNGSIDSAGNFTSGGAFDCNPNNLKKAFDYIKKKMKASNCQPAEFQFHSTGHGGGYHNNPANSSSRRADGIVGGRLDTNNDEEHNKTNENDIIISSRGRDDIDGDGRADIEVTVVPDPRDTMKRIKRVRFDSNGDGTFDQVIGYDFNGDGRVSKADSGWVAPDLNRNGQTDDVGWDDVMQISGGEEVTDDELRGLMQGLLDSTGLDKAHSRAEFGQCFGGSFLDDLRGVTTVATSAAARDEYSYSYRGPHGYNIYEKTFIDSLNAGHTWNEAHRMAVDSTKKELEPHGIVQTPQLTDNSELCIVVEGPYRKGNKVCIRVINLCGKTVVVHPFINTYNFGIESYRIAQQDWGQITLKNNEKKEYCVPIPPGTTKYCFLGGNWYDNHGFKFKAKWLNNVQYKVPVGTSSLIVPFDVGGNMESGVRLVSLRVDPSGMPPNWHLTLSQEHVVIEDHKAVEVTAMIEIPSDAQPGDIAHFHIDGWSEEPEEEHLGFVEGDIQIIVPGEELNMELTDGWNLVSMNGIPEIPILRDIFHDANVILTFDSYEGYHEMTEFMLNKGFWIDNNGDNSYSYPGIKFDNYTVELNEGWSLIGGLSEQPAIPEITGGGEILGLFAFNKDLGYYPIEAIQPGEAIWINLSAPAQVNMQQVLQGYKIERPAYIWELPLYVQGEDMGHAITVAHAVVGVSVDAEEIIEAAPAPPEHSSYISLVRFDDYNRILANVLYLDIKKEAGDKDTLRWFVQVDVNGSFGDRKLQTVLSWEPDMLDNGDKNQKWILVPGIVKEGLGEPRVDMQKQNSVSVVSSDTVYYTIISYKELPDNVDDNDGQEGLLDIVNIVPNPFNSSVDANFTLGQYAEVKIEIFDTFGRKVLSVNKGTLPAGNNTFTWNGLNEQNKEVSNGNYYIRFTVKSGNSIITAVKLIGKIK